jgi:arginine-tRNA-protein transferase
VRVLTDVAPGEFGALLARGWRRFGRTFFRPACESCAECVSLRLLVSTFRPSRSQRRARNQASDLDRIVDRPRVDSERVELYRRWHAQREVHRGWHPNPMAAEDYAEEFAYPHAFSYEVAFRDPRAADRLVGLGLVDAVPDALSAVTFFWDPDHAPSSLGVVHVVMLVEQAAAAGLRAVYLGYRVSGCASLAYKARYRPHELLEARFADREAPVWHVRS